MNKQFSINKYAIEIFFLQYSKKPILQESGMVPTPSFFSIPRPAREKNLDRRQRRHLFHFSTESHLPMTSVAELGKESQEHSFHLIYWSDRIWRIHQLNTSYMAKNTTMSFKTPVTTCVTAFERFAKPLQRYPLMGTCNFGPYLSINTFDKNIP